MFLSPIYEFFSTKDTYIHHLIKYHDAYLSTLAQGKAVGLVIGYTGLKKLWKIRQTDFE